MSHADALQDALYALGDIYAESDRLAAIEDVSAARPAVAAMKALKQADITPHVISHLLCQVSALIERAGWSHTVEAESARQELDAMADNLKERA